VRNSLKEQVMKKIVFAVICGLFLVGCAKNEPKPASHEGCGCSHHQKMMQENMPSCPHHGMQGAMQGSMHGDMQGCPAHAK
jgi:putative lipoprotein